jgi:hypothetical protein
VNLVIGLIPHVITESRVSAFELVWLNVFDISSLPALELTLHRCFTRTWEAHQEECPGLSVIFHILLLSHILAADILGASLRQRW